MTPTLAPADPWASTDHDPTAWHNAALDQRTELLDALADTLRALTRAAAALTALTSHQGHDAEFAATPAGCDIRAFLDDSARNIRAASAITRAIIEHDTA